MKQNDLVLTHVYCYDNKSKEDGKEHLCVNPNNPDLYFLKDTSFTRFVKLSIKREKNEDKNKQTSCSNAKFHYATTRSNVGVKRFMTVMNFCLKCENGQNELQPAYSLTENNEIYEFSDVVNNELRENIIYIPIWFCLISYTPQFEFQK